jgi:transcriptional regulator with XRE-family HTH domain
MVRTPEALINPDVLLWARQSAGLSPEEAAHKVNVAVERLTEWELGHSRPTIAQLRKLGRAYHRPLALFYLSKPPKLFRAMHDYRRIAGVLPETASPELALEIRRARDRREIALELLAEMRITPPSFSLKLDLGEAFEEAAAKMRDYLGVTRKAQESWTSDYEALNEWRSAL